MRVVIQHTCRTLTKRSGGDDKEEAKTPSDIAADLIKDLIEERGLKSCILNLEEIKGKLDEDNKGPYQNVFL